MTNICSFGIVTIHLILMSLLSSNTDAFVPSAPRMPTQRSPFLHDQQQPYHHGTFTTSTRRSWFLTLRTDHEGDGDEGNNDDESIPAKNEISTEPVKEKSVPASWKRTDVVNDESKVNSALGLGRGAVLLTIALLINIWFFTIPTEFRRTRLCNEFDTETYPQLCMTPKMFVDGIVEYYKNGKEKSGSLRRLCYMSQVSLPVLYCHAMF
jgi:hypothetical protein